MLELLLRAGNYCCLLPVSTPAIRPADRASLPLGLLLPFPILLHRLGLSGYTLRLSSGYSSGYLPVLFRAFPYICPGIAFCRGGLRVYLVNGSIR